MMPTKRTPAATKAAEKIKKLIAELQIAWPSLDDHEILLLGLRALGSLCGTAGHELPAPTFSTAELRSETWVSLSQFPDCAVSSLGRVRGGARDSMRIRKISQQTGRYAVVFLSGKQVQVSRLVAEHFVRPPEAGEVVNHLNGNKLDNRVNNLAWTSQKENIRHSNDTGLRSRSSRKMRALSADERSEIRQFRSLLRKGLLAKIYGIKSSEVALVASQSKSANG